MRKEIKNNGIRWINITDPNKKDVEYLKNNFNLCPSILKEFIPPIKRPKVEEYKDYLFIVIHFPVFNRNERKTISTELDIILYKDIIITSHTGFLLELKNFFKKCAASELARNYYIKINAACLAYKLLDNLIDTRLPMLDHIDDNINKVENRIFRGDEKKMVSEIAIIKRDIINFRKIIKPQKMVLESLSRLSYKISSENLSKLAAEVIGSNMKVWNTLENHKEMIEALEHTNESLFSYRLNDIMKTLTIFSVIIFPLTLVVNIFGINITDGMPFQETSNGFWIIIFIIICLSFLMLAFFKYKKWL